MAELLDITSDDWRMYYSGTTVGVPIGNEILPFFIDDIYPRHPEEEDDEGDVKLSGSMYSKSSSGLAQWVPAECWWLDDDVVTEIPHCGFFNIEEYVVYLDRQAIKQWKRGISGSQLSSSSPVYMELRSLGIEPRSSTEAVVAYAFYNPSYPDAMTALLEVQSGLVLARAFSNDFCFHIRSGVSNVLLSYRDKVCGHVADGKLYLLSSLHYLEAELSEFIEVHYE